MEAREAWEAFKQEQEDRTPMSNEEALEAWGIPIDLFSGEMGKGLIEWAKEQAVSGRPTSHIVLAMFLFGVEYGSFLFREADDGA